MQNAKRKMQSVGAQQCAEKDDVKDKRRTYPSFLLAKRRGDHRLRWWVVRKRSFKMPHAVADILHSASIILHFLFALQIKTYAPLGHTTSRRTVAHRTVRLMLLGSPPDMVHGAPSHRTHPSHDRIERKLLLHYILITNKNQ